MLEAEHNEHTRARDEKPSTVLVFALMWQP